MTREETTFVGIALLGLAALVIYDVRTKNAVATPDAPTLDPLQAMQSTGPAYLIYNQPWAFSPPVGNVLPAVTSGQAGQVAGQGPTPTSPATCNTCG